MTPARQPCYIITEEQVEYIEPEFPITAMRIRSRPHTSATAPACPYSADDDMCLECKAHEQKIADAAAKAVREQEAIRWTTALNTLIATESKRKDKESVDMVYSYRVAQIIESLRQQEQQ